MGCQNSSVSQDDIKIPQETNAFFQPGKLGSIELKNRLIMASMTRLRADPTTSIPSDLMVEYYSQRAGFGAVFTESSQISADSNCFPGSGGIHNKEQVEGWKKVTKKVHEKGGKIIIQILHCGRAILPDQTGGKQPMAPSAIGIKAPHHFTKKSYGVPREMTKNDIKDVIEQYRQAAINAKEAGFDGIELHGGNGFLVDQFLKDGVNQRTDEYGGSIQNRSRFLFEVIDVLKTVYPIGQIGVRFTPTGRYNEMYDSNPLELFKYILKELEKKKIGFVEIKKHSSHEEIKQDKNATHDEQGLMYPSVQIPDFFNQMRTLFSGSLILNDGINYDTGSELLRKKKADFISFATFAISNPDLPERFKNGWELAKEDPTLNFAPGPKGYIDYPVYSVQTKS